MTERLVEVVLAVNRKSYCGLTGVQQQALFSSGFLTSATLPTLSASMGLSTVMERSTSAWSTWTVEAWTW